MTGRAAGFCIGYQMPGYANSVGRRSCVDRGRGVGRSRVWHNQYYATGLPRWAGACYGRPASGACRPTYGGPVPPTAPAAKEKLDMLEQQVDGLKRATAQIEQRIEQLRSEAAEK